jgi:lauroyl/myristoyl acyltransferase
VAILTLPFERWLAQYLASESGRQRSERTKRRIYAALRRVVGDARAQRLIVRWLELLCGSRFAQRSLFPEAAAHLRRFASVFELPPAQTPGFVALSMTAREWREWRRIAEPPAGTLARVTRVVGQEHLDAGLHEGKGVILLLHHSQFSRLALVWLSDRGYETATVGMPNQDLEKRGLQTPAQKSFELGRQMHAAKHLLGKGGVVINVPDAYQNLQSFRMVEFFGRLRPIATGFAELALKSGARAMPIAYRLARSGLFELEFAAPLQLPTPGTNHEACIDALVGQYVDFLRAEWRPYPWDLHWYHLDFFCQLPRVYGRAVRTAANRRG